MTTQIDLAKRAAQYVALRAKKKEIQEKHKEELKPVNEMLDRLEALFLDHLNNTGVDSVKTAGGTFYKTHRDTASLDVPDEFMRYVIGSEAWDLLDRKANVAAIRDFIAEHGTTPPGVKFSSTIEVGVKAPTKK